MAQRKNGLSPIFSGAPKQVTMCIRAVYLAAGASVCIPSLIKLAVLFFLDFLGVEELGWSRLCLASTSGHYAELIQCNSVDIPNVCDII